MATEECVRVSRLATFKNIVRLIPALVLMAATLDTVSCKNSGGLFPLATNSGSPTATATTGTGALAYVTNFNDAKVSSFTRNITTGVLTLTGTITAGKTKGPKGLVPAPSGSFLYVANNADDNIYEFSINSTNATLTPLSPASVSNGKNSGPDQIAINPAGTFAWVTGENDGSITTYTVNTSTGQLTLGTKVTGLTSPFGITVDPTGSFVYVADNGAGLVYSYSIGTNGALTQIGSPVFDLGSAGGTPGFIAVDPSATFIYVTDLDAGVLSVLGTSSGTLSFAQIVPSTTTPNLPIGIAYASVSTIGNFVFTANQDSSSLWAFLLTTPGFPSQPVEFGNGNLDAPTGLIVDPQNAFLYTTNQDAGTVSQFSLAATCFTPTFDPCFVGNVATEKTGTSSGPFGITLAQ
jgi:6-phosphogluconolactonase (cycloisomerase 2 family)